MTKECEAIFAVAPLSSENTCTALPEEYAIRLPSRTARPHIVLQLLAEGESYKMCADRLTVSLDTIRFHVRQIYEALHVHSKSEAVSKALRKGFIR